MAYYRFFTVEHFDNVSVMTFTEAAATRASEEDELRVELNEFASSVESTCVVVSFAQLATCQSALIGVLVGLKKLLKGENRLHLCEMNSHLKDKFDRLHLDRVFAIHSSVADAIAACKASGTRRGEHDRHQSND